MEGFRDTVGDVSGRLGDQLPKSLSAAIALLGQGARPAFLEMQRAIEAANGALDDQKAALDDQKAALGPYKDAVDAAKAAVQDQQRALRDLRGTLKDQQDALEPLKARYDDLTQAVKDADAAIRDLQSTPLQGTADFGRSRTPSGRSRTRSSPQTPGATRCGRPSGTPRTRSGGSPRWTSPASRARARGATWTTSASARPTG
jgi:septal ring factor EnvC (AmiA/AmiB activator)